MRKKRRQALLLAIHTRGYRSRVLSGFAVGSSSFRRLVPSSARARDGLQVERATEEGDVGCVDVPRLVPGFVAKRAHRRFAPNLNVADDSVASEVGLLEAVAGDDTAVVQRPVAESLVHVQVDAELLAVVKHEHPWPVSAPRQDPVDAKSDGDGDQQLELFRRKQRSRSPCPRLPSDERVDSPTATNRERDACLDELAENPTCGLDRHHVVHATNGTPPDRAREWTTICDLREESVEAATEAPLGPR